MLWTGKILLRICLIAVSINHLTTMAHQILEQKVPCVCLGWMQMKLFLSDMLVLLEKDGDLDPSYEK
jgi:hypothetical protein